MATTDVFADLRERFAAAGQSHVFQWYDEGLLSEDQAASLYKELAPLDLPRINKLFEVGDGENEGRWKKNGWLVPSVAWGGSALACTQSFSLACLPVWPTPYVEAKNWGCEFL